MNILYITTHLNIGGITSYILTLARGFKKRGHSIYIASSAAGEMSDKICPEYAQFISIPIKTKSEIDPKVLLSYFMLKGYLTKYGIDIIHTHTRVSQVLGCLLSHFCRKAHISTCHGFFKDKFSRRIFPCWGDKVIAVSEPVKEHLIGDLGVRADKIRLIHSGINSERFKENNKGLREILKQSLGLKDGPVIGILARLSDVKGHSYLIRAMPLILDKFPKAQLFIIGEGKIKQDLVNLARNLKVDKNTLFIPNVEDSPKILSLMDIFVMPSLEEGLGLGLMEAMASGLAVIGSDVGGIKSLIKHEFNGLLVPPADPAAIASAIIELLGNPLKAKNLAKNASIFVANNFSEEKMILQTEKLYFECLRN
jgi:glycosyltransferase involved in cell wall biosynthesis